MLDRLSGDGSSEMARNESFNESFNVSEGFNVSGSLKPSKLCDLETLLSGLLADAEFGNDRLVTLGIVFLEVVEQATPLADQHEKAAARAVVFLVRLEVLRQLPNAFAQQRDLNFRAAGIARSPPVLVNEGFLVLSG
jgi:hypothetical protein